MGEKVDRADPVLKSRVAALTCTRRQIKLLKEFHFDLTKTAGVIDAVARAWKSAQEPHYLPAIREQAISLLKEVPEAILKLHEMDPAPSEETRKILLETLADATIASCLRSCLVDLMVEKGAEEGDKNGSKT